MQFISSSLTPSTFKIHLESDHPPPLHPDHPGPCHLLFTWILPLPPAMVCSSHSSQSALAKCDQGTSLFCSNSSKPSHLRGKSKSLQWPKKPTGIFIPPPALSYLTSHHHPAPPSPATRPPHQSLDMPSGLLHQGFCTDTCSSLYWVTPPQCSHYPLPAQSRPLREECPIYPHTTATCQPYLDTPSP